MATIKDRPTVIGYYRYSDIVSAKTLFDWTLSRLRCRCTNGEREDSDYPYKREPLHEAIQA